MRIKFVFWTRFYSRIFRNIRKKKLFFWTFWRVLSYGHTQKMIFPRFLNLEKLSEFNLGMYWGPWNWSLSSKRDFKLMIWSRVVIGWRTLSRALLKTLRTESFVWWSEEFLTWRHINDPWIFMCAFIKPNMVPNNAGKWRDFFWVDLFAIFGLTIGPYSFLPIYISLCDSHRNCSSSDLSRLSYPNLTLFHLICKVVQDELIRVFKLMPTDLHYEPIKSMLVENQPIRSWAKSIVFETRLRHTCRFTRTSFTSNNKNLTVIIV